MRHFERGEQRDFRVLESHFDKKMAPKAAMPSAIALLMLPGSVISSGMRDPALALVLRALHSDVRANWTVAQLAKLVGMSRSAFAARFGELVCCAPIEYLLRWRMILAQDALSCGVKSLDRLADEIGYESASAFSTAFRRRLGCSSRKFVRERQGGNKIAM